MNEDKVFLWFSAIIGIGFPLAMLGGAALLALPCVGVS